MLIFFYKLLKNQTIYFSTKKIYGRPQKKMTKMNLILFLRSLSKKINNAVT